MEYLSKKMVAISLVLAVLILPAVSYGQFGGIVYDPTNYANAVLRYNQLVQQLAQLRQTYQQVLNQYNLALQMSRNLRNMPARYRAMFSQWRSFTANDLYGNTNPWVSAVNGAGAQSVGPAYLRATIPFLTYNQADLNAINPTDAENLKSAYASSNSPMEPTFQLLQQSETFAQTLQLCSNRSAILRKTRYLVIRRSIAKSAS